MSSSLFSLETFSFLQRTASLYLTRLNRTKKIHQTITISRSDDFSKNDHLILFLFPPAWWLAHQHTHPLYWCFTGAHRPPSAASSACGGKSVSEVERRTSSGLCYVSKRASEQMGLLFHLKKSHGVAKAISSQNMSWNFRLNYWKVPEALMSRVDGLKLLTARPS